MAILATLKTFEGGHYFDRFVGSARAQRLTAAPLPARVIIPLRQGIWPRTQSWRQDLQVEAKPAVEVGARVRAGQVIARDDDQLCTPVHASLSGTVEAIEKRPHPLGGWTTCVLIQSDNKDERVLLHGGGLTFERMEPPEVGKILYDAGVTDGGAAGFPTALRSALARPDQIRYLVIKTIETDPYLDGDDQLLYEEFDKFVQGMRVLRAALGNVQVHVAIGYNKPRLIEELETRMEYHDWFYIHPVRPKYPQGDDDVLIRTLLGLRVPSGGLATDMGVVVQDVQHAVAAYEAVVEGKPFIERVVSVAGSAVAHPVNLRVRVGTTVGELLRGRMGQPARVIVGSLMRGLAQNDEYRLKVVQDELAEIERKLARATADEKTALAPLLKKSREARAEWAARVQHWEEAPITRNTGAVIALAEARRELFPLLEPGFDKNSYIKAFVSLPWVPKQATTSMNGNPRPCVKCGFCVDVCPQGLLPLFLGEYAAHDLLSEAEDLDLYACIECGLCAYVCPSKIPLLEQIRAGKLKIREGQT